MLHRIRIALLIAVMAAPLAVATTASAAPATWNELTATLRSEQGNSVLLVTGELPKTTRLPAVVQITVPAGLELRWAGELLGGDTEDDLPVKYAKTSRGGADVYGFTVRRSRTAQLEFVWPHQPLFDGKTYTSGLEWTADQPIPLVRLSVRLPQSARIAAPADGAIMLPGDGGFTFYSKDFTNVRAGQDLELFFAYSLPSSETKKAPASDSTLAIVLLALTFTAAGAVAFTAIRRKLTAAETEPTVLPLTKNAVLISLAESNRSDFGRVDFAVQSPDQRVFSAIWALEGAANMDGFVSYFDSGEDSIPFAAQALDIVGATHAAAIVRRAADLPPESSNDLTDEQLEELEELDEAFMAYPDDLTALLYDFVAARPESFGVVPAVS